MKSTRGALKDVDEQLKELDQGLTRLRVAYEQYFLGNVKREPSELRTKVQRIVTEFSNRPLRNSGQKFRFNQLNSKYQVYRQLWGRSLRELERGTHRFQRFRAGGPANGAGATHPAEQRKPAASRSNVVADKLYRSLMAARARTGEDAGGLTAEKLASIMRKQTETFQAKGSKGKLHFRVVIENNKAKVKASVVKG